MKKLLEKFKKKVDTSDTSSTRVEPLKSSISEYYSQASGWAYDVFDSVVTSRNRYRIAFIGATALSFLLVLTMMLMIPLRKVVPIIIHKDANNVVWVTTDDFSKKYTHNNEEIKSNIYHYIKYFETYDATTFSVWSDYVKQMSSPNVYSQYLSQVSASDSYVSQLGIKGHRDVVVEGIQLINNGKTNLKNKNNTALITFKTQDDLYSGAVENTKYWQLFLTWEYKGPPKGLKNQFINYSGFTVTSYQITPINYEKFKQNSGE